MIDLLGSGVTWISGVPFGQVGLEVEQVGVVGQARRAPRRWPSPRRSRCRRATTTLRLLELKPGELRDGDVEAVGLDRRERVGEDHRVLRQVDGVDEADRHPGAVGRPAAHRGGDGLEAGLALAGDRGLDEHDVRVLGQDLLGLLGGARTASVLAPGGGAIVGLDDVLRARVDERRREQRRERAGDEEQDEGDADDADPGQAAAQRRP